MTTIKVLGIAVAGVIVGLLLSASNSGNFGGVYNQVINEFRAGLKAGDTNQLVIDEDGDLTAPNITATGVITAEESNVFGSANSYNPTYYGAGDGCTAVLYTASTTATVSATSTTFCN